MTQSYPGVTGTVRKIKGEQGAGIVVGGGSVLWILGRGSDAPQVLNGDQVLGIDDLRVGWPVRIRVGEDGAIHSIEVLDRHAPGNDPFLVPLSRIDQLEVQARGAAVTVEFSCADHRGKSDLCFQVDRDGETTLFLEGPLASRRIKKFIDGLGWPEGFACLGAPPAGHEVRDGGFPAGNQRLFRVKVALRIKQKRMSGEYEVQINDCERLLKSAVDARAAMSGPGRDHVPPSFRNS
ncbi:MAG: hypothetical protein WD535_02510 [Thermaerobacterales bacterium]